MKGITFIFLLFAFNIFGQNSVKLGKDSIITVQLKIDRIPELIEVSAEIIDGDIIFEGDILLGKLEDFTNNAAGVIGISNTWNDGIVPYVIQANHTHKETVNQAISYLNSLEEINITLVDNAILNRGNYIEFKTVEGFCNSNVGRVGGRQFINTDIGCGFGATVHEIMHALGFFHEQSRQDRDNYVSINFNNIETGKEHNFEKYITGQDIGNYDYGSIMHYGATDFSKNGMKTIEIKIPPGNENTIIGQRSGLSKGDIEGINRLYPYCDCNSVPQNLNITQVSSFNCYQASNILSSSAFIPTNSLSSFKAGTRIELLPGTEIDGKLIAEVSNDFCDGSFRRIENQPNNELSQIYNLADNIEVIKSNFDLKVKPNPFNINTTIEYNNVFEGKPTSIRLLDLYGRQIRIIKDGIIEGLGIKTINLEARGLSQGSYILLFQSGSFIETKKLMIINR